MAKTVLIVEDNELNMKLFHDLLEAHGYHTVGTRNGIEALELARKHRPDLIIMDMEMPQLDGLSATRRIRQQAKHSHVPIVAVSAYGADQFRALALEAGCDEYVSTPFEPKALEGIIRELMH